jgi:hypothetical protein
MKFFSYGEEQNIVNIQKVILFWSVIDMAEDTCPICGSTMIINKYPLQRELKKKCTNEKCKHNKEPIVIHQ